jgi:hypothetical protein
MKMQAKSAVERCSSCVRLEKERPGFDARASLRPDNCGIPVWCRMTDGTSGNKQTSRTFRRLSRDGLCIVLSNVDLVPPSSNKLCSLENEKQHCTKSVAAWKHGVCGIRNVRVGEI